MELAAIKAIKTGGAFRSTISMDPLIALAGIRLADREQRDFSNLCSVALAERDQQTPAPDPEQNTLFAALAVALERRPAIKTELEGIIENAARATRAKRGK